MNKFFLLPLLSIAVVSGVQGQPNEKVTAATAVKPKPMTKAEILSWLIPDKHVEDQRKITDMETMTPEPHTVPKEYLIIVQQLAAIESAGELKDKELIPSLLDYMDYVSPNTLNAPSFWAWNTIKWRRKRYAATDALMKINSAEGLSSYIEADHPLKKRVSALSVLRELDYDKAVELGKQLLEDPEAKKSANTTEWIQSLMQKEVPPPKLTLAK